MTKNGWYYKEERVEYEGAAFDTMSSREPTKWIFRSSSSEYFNSNINSQSGYEILSSPQTDDILKR